MLCAPVWQHRVLQVVQFLFFFLISKITANMFTTAFQNFSAIGWTVCAPVRQHRVLQLVQFLNFQNHREHVYNNIWKFHRNRMNGVCSCKATTDTPASTIFKFPKAHVQQPVDMSIQLPADLQCDPSNGSARCFRLSIVGWHSAPLWPFGAIIHACVATRGATLCIDVTVSAPLTVTCVFHLVWIYHTLL